VENRPKNGIFQDFFYNKGTFEKVSFFTVFVLWCVSQPEKRKKNSPKKFENLSILANFDQF
jgi:hypothetical protein